MLKNRYNETLKFIRNQIKISPDILIILGSGFGSVAENIDIKISIPYKDIPYFKKTTAHTHAGNLVFGKISGKNVIVMQGRFHVYEGYEVSQTTYPVRIAAELGAKKLISTSLAGGINEIFNIGDFMVIEDHLNLSGVNPLIWDLQEPVRRYTDMYEAYNPSLIKLIENVAFELSIPLRKGVFAYLTGPNFETRAELKMLKILGADVVGWSLVPEVMEARKYEMDVLGLVCISDISNPDKFGPVNLKKIYQTGFKKTATLFSLLKNFISKL